MTPLLKPTYVVDLCYCICICDTTSILINCNAIKMAEDLNRDGENASEPDGSEEAET